VTFIIEYKYTKHRGRTLKKVKQAVIMVGGQGTRLLPLTKYRPKPVLPVLDKPCLRYLIESFAGSGIEEIILACGYRSSQLVESIGNGKELGISIDYSYEDEPLGTAGAMKKVEDRLDKVYAAANGDVFADFSLEEQVADHFKFAAEATLALTPVENPCEFGIVGLDSENRIIKFLEKPKPEDVFSNLINAGIYIINRSALSYVPENKFFDFSKDLFPILMNENKRMQGYLLKGLWRDVGRPQDLLDANKIAASKLYDKMYWGRGRVASSKIQKPFFAGKGSSIADSSISGSIILENSAVSNSKLINSLIMKDCKVENASIVNSIIGAGCTIRRGAEITGAVIEDGTTVEAGIKIIEKRII